MNHTQQDAALRDIPEEVHDRRRIILGELKERTLWFVWLRWWVPPSIVAGVAVAKVIGVECAAGPLLLVAAFILGYNVVFFLQSRSVQEEHGWQTTHTLSLLKTALIRLPAMALGTAFLARAIAAVLGRARPALTPGWQVAAAAVFALLAIAARWTIQA